MRPPMFAGPMFRADSPATIGSYRPKEENNLLTLDVEKARLDSAPGFDKDHWPDMADPGWEKSIHAWYGTQPSIPAPRL